MIGVGITHYGSCVYVIYKVYETFVILLCMRSLLLTSLWSTFFFIYICPSRALYVMFNVYESLVIVICVKSALLTSMWLHGISFYLRLFFQGT